MKRLKIKNPGNLVFAFSLVFLYSFLSLAYFTALDPKLYVKDVFKCGITFANPIFYIVFVALFIFAYSAFLRQKLRVVAPPVIAMAVVLPLFYLLIDLKIGMRLSYPFGVNRGIYGIYAVAYVTFFISLFSLFSGLIFRKLLKAETPGPLACEDSKLHNIIFHLPILAYFIYGTGTLFARGFPFYAILALAFFFLAILFETTSTLLRKIKTFLVGFAQNERLLLVTIFVAAFLIRYFWGLRLLGITGQNFILASDDGACYDNFASIIAGGRLLQKSSLYGTVTGFGYWYFLAAVYKIFGLHNFKAVIVIQSFIGAFVPVLTYFIGKQIFKTRFVPVLAAIVTSLDMTLIFLSVVIGMEAIYIPLVVLALSVTVFYLSGGKILDYKKAFLLGAAFGLAYNARAPELLLFPIVLAAVIYIFMRKKMLIKKMAYVFTSLFAGFILLISVQYATNYLVYGERPGLPGATVGSFHVGVAEGGHTDENKILGQMGFSPFEDFKGSAVVFANNPATVSKLIIKGFSKRLVILYFLPNFGVFNPVYLVNPASGYFFRFPVYVQCCGYLLVALGVLAAFFKRENFLCIVVLFMFLFYMSSRVALFFVLNCRYRAVLMPVFILFFAYGVNVFYKKVKDSYKNEVLNHVA